MFTNYQQAAAECGQNLTWSREQAAAVVISMRSLTDLLHKHLQKGRRRNESRIVMFLFFVLHYSFAWSPSTQSIFLSFCLSYTLNPILMRKSCCCHGHVICGLSHFKASRLILCQFIFRLTWRSNAVCLFKCLQMDSDWDITSDLQSAETQSPPNALNLKYLSTEVWHVPELAMNTTANLCATMWVMHTLNPKHWAGLWLEEPSTWKLWVTDVWVFQGKYCEIQNSTFSPMFAASCWPWYFRPSTHYIRGGKTM